MKNKKQSIVFGALVSSAGILISKILGLVYVIPLNAIAGDMNMQYYGFAYTIYGYILNVSIAGIPYAIATLVAKYNNANDYKTTLLIKKLSLGIMLVLGLISMFFMLLFAPTLAKNVLSVNFTPESFEITKSVLILISFALFFVPLLSAYRGFYQGLKEMEVYAFSQVLEQLTRVLFLLGMGALAVYVFDANRIWAVYFAVFSASFAAICALVHFCIYDSNHIVDIKEKALDQEDEGITDKKQLVKEIILIALPYLLVAIVGYANDMIDWSMFSKALEATGVNGNMSNYIYGTMIATHISKVISIPQILALGFSVSSIPYITVALENKNYKELKKHLFDSLETVIYIVVPLGICLFFFSREVMFVLFGNPTISFGTFSISQLDYEAYLLQWRTIDAVLGTLAPICTSFMMASRLWKKNILNLAIGAIIKLVLVTPCIMWFGMSGSSISNLVSYGVVIALDLYCLAKTFKFSWMRTFKRSLLIVACGAVMALVTLLVQIVSPDLVAMGRMMCFVLLAIEGLIVLAVYLVISNMLYLPQTLFKMDLRRLLKRVLR